MSDIIEMAAIGEDSGWTFHKYINVNYKLPLGVVNAVFAKITTDMP